MRGDMPSPSSYPSLEESFMKICYCLVLALLLLVITPVAAADMYSDMTTDEVINDV